MHWKLNDSDARKHYFIDERKQLLLELSSPLNVDCNTIWCFRGFRKYITKKHIFIVRRTNQIGLNFAHPHESWSFTDCHIMIWSKIQEKLECGQDHTKDMLVIV